MSIDDVMRRNPFSLYYVRSPGLDGDWERIVEDQKIKARRLKEERENVSGTKTDEANVSIMFFINVCCISYLLSLLISVFF